MANTLTSSEFWQFGERVEGYEIRVFNERELRASAGLLFLFGASGYATVLFTGNFSLLRAFAVVFMIDMFLRLFVSPRLSPSLAIARLIVYRQRPEWVGAPQKAVAFSLGLGLSMFSCASLGLLALPVWVALTLCGLCLALLFAETAFGICVGCELYRRFSKTEPLYCPGDVCNYMPLKR